MNPQSQDLVLKHGYICRRPLGGLPFAFDLLAHSAQLFDAYTTQQAEQMRETCKPDSGPVSRFMVERFEDIADAKTKKTHPHIGKLAERTRDRETDGGEAVREVDIGEPYRLWYQASAPGNNSGRPGDSWYQVDGRTYECFKLDGYRWTKQIRGSAVDITLGELVDFVRTLDWKAYDIGQHTCHDAREKIMEALGVAKPPQRAFTRFTEFLRPAISSTQGASTSTSKSSSSNRV